MDRDQATGQQSEHDSGSESRRRKRPIAKAAMACDSCRLKKIKCDGNRPCRSCLVLAPPAASDGVHVNTDAHGNRTDAPTAASPLLTIPGLVGRPKTRCSSFNNSWTEPIIFFELPASPKSHPRPLTRTAHLPAPSRVLKQKTPVG